jgi:hypothetical protein
MRHDAKRWDALVREFTEKSAFTQTVMRADFLRTKCPDGGNVREFLDELRTKCESLLQSGVDINSQDFRSTIISSLPRYLSGFASAQLTSAQVTARAFAMMTLGATPAVSRDVLQSVQEVDPDVLIHHF